MLILKFQANGGILKKIEINDFTNTDLIDFYDDKGTGFQYEFEHFSHCVYSNLIESHIAMHYKIELAIQLIQYKQ